VDLAVCQLSVSFTATKVAYYLDLPAVYVFCGLNVINYL